jgi:cell division protease FtsH
MRPDPWLPSGYLLPDGQRLRRVQSGGESWQLYATDAGSRVLLVEERLARRWIDSALVQSAELQAFAFGDRALHSLPSPATKVLEPVAIAQSPNRFSEAMAFATALRASRDLDRESSLHDAIYVERLSRLLPTYGTGSKVGDALVLGTWLSGGAHISATSVRRLGRMLSWLSEDQILEISAAAGLGLQRDDTVTGADDDRGAMRPSGPCGLETGAQFELAGRPELEAFFNEHIIDIVRNVERYKALGIDFPGATILNGPPGCGKTYAVEQLVAFLGWPSFYIDASSVASPYIHETSRKVAKVFEDAIAAAPSVLVIDEMEAFLADREMGSGHHRVEEMAEFLRRIPEAVKSRVLLIAMTNRIEMIDPAILRRGRFDHHIKVDFATVVEIAALLRKLLASLPTRGEIEVESLAGGLSGRPLSDVVFVVREAARLAARAGQDRVDQANLLAALQSTGSRTGSDRRIGFV